MPNRYCTICNKDPLCQQAYEYLPTESKGNCMGYHCFFCNQHIKHNSKKKTCVRCSKIACPKCEDNFPNDKCKERCKILE